MRRFRPVVTWLLIWTVLIMVTGFFVDAVLLLHLGASLPPAINSLASPWRCCGYPLSNAMSAPGAAVMVTWCLGLCVVAVLGLRRRLPGTRQITPGHCAFCGYDCTMRDGRQATCPECGETSNSLDIAQK